MTHHFPRPPQSTPQVFRSLPRMLRGNADASAAAVLQRCLRGSSGRLRGGPAGWHPSAAAWAQHRASAAVVVPGGCLRGARAPRNASAAAGRCLRGAPGVSAVPPRQMRSASAAAAKCLRGRREVPPRQMRSASTADAKCLRGRCEVPPRQLTQSASAAGATCLRGRCGVPPRQLRSVSATDEKCHVAAIAAPLWPRLSQRCPVCVLWRHHWGHITWVLRRTWRFVCPSRIVGLYDCVWVGQPHERAGIGGGGGRAGLEGIAALPMPSAVPSLPNGAQGSPQARGCWIAPLCVASSAARCGRAG